MPKTGAMIELQLGGVWTDITPDCYLRDRIKVTRGRADEGVRVDPGSCTITFNNKLGKYSKHNPLSPLYGLIGRNTPVRVSTAAGSAFLGLPPDNPVRQRVTTPTTAALQITGDIDVRFDVQPDDWFANNVVELGGKWGISGQQSWHAYLAAGSLRLGWTTDGTTEVLAAAAYAATEMRPRMVVRATLDVNNGSGGHTVRFYVGQSMTGPWTQLGGDQVLSGTTATFSSTASVELGDIVSTNSFDVPARLYAVQIRNGIDGTVVASPDFTAQQPGALSFTDASGVPWTASSTSAITNRRTRFVGEISSWPTKWDVTGGDVYVQVQAAGIMRRLGTGTSPLDSTLKRRIPSDPNVLAYWPMEEGDGATQAYSPVPGVPPMRALGLQWGADDSLAGSLALPAVQSPCSISGSVPTAAAPTQWRTEFVYRIDTAPGSASTFINFTSNGTVKKWTVRYLAGEVDVIGVDNDGNTVVNQGITVGTNIFGVWVRQVFTLTQSGGTVSWNIKWVIVGELDGGSFGSTYSGTTGAVTGVNSTFSTGTVGARIGHIAAFSVAATSIFNDADAGFDGDLSAARIARLTTEQGVAYVTPYGRAGTAAMGPQGVDTFLNLLGNAEDADVGILYEARESIALAYRPRTSLYNQPVALALDYTRRGDVAPDLTPTEDDTDVHNDVTVSRPAGSSARVALGVGALSINPPPAGIGSYPTSTTASVQTDDQLPDMAGWLLHLGTWDAARYPQATVNLAAGPHLVDQATAVDVGDRMQIANPPPWLPPETIDLLAQGYTETIGWADWIITFNCTPGGPWTVGILEDPDLPARLDTAGSTLAVAAPAASTSLVLATTTGPRWVDSITYPAEFPFALAIAGERVQVNGLAGVVSDNYTRTVSSGWGAATTGDTWTASGGSASDFSVSSGLGRMSLGTVNVARWALAPSAYADVNLSVFLSTSKLAVGAPQYISLAARAADVNNCYTARLAFNTDQTAILAIVKRVASVETVLGTYVVPGLTHVAGVFFGLRFRVVGSTLQARAWPFAYEEPQGWPLTVTDTALTAAGNIGISSLLTTGTTNAAVVASFDGFQQSTPQIAFVDRAVNGISKAQLAGADVRLADPTYVAL